MLPAVAIALEDAFIALATMPPKIESLMRIVPSGCARIESLAASMLTHVVLWFVMVISLDSELSDTYRNHRLNFTRFGVRA